jgi:predicted amidophosphoribosyltransferase
LDDGVGTGLMFGVGAACGLLMGPPIYRALAAPRPRAVVIVCLNCSAKNLEANRYCSNCGEPLYPSVECKACGRKMLREWSYCSNCGTPLMKKAGKSSKG